MEKPKFTIVYNSVSDDGYVGVCWEFFTDEIKAKSRYDFLSGDEKYCPTMRPYHHDTDKHHLGACHTDIKNLPSEKWTKLNSEFNNALEKFDEWTPRLRKPIEAANHENKIIELADEYVKNQINEGEGDVLLSEDDLKLWCKKDFMEGFLKCEQLQIESKKVEKDFEDNRDILDKFLSPENSQIEIAIRTSITMHDYDNWDNGTYKGKMGEVVPHVLEHIKKHVIEFAEYLHKHYPNVIKPKNYLDVPIPKGERKWMRAFFSDDIDEKTAEKIYDEFLEYVKNKKI